MSELIKNRRSIRKYDPDKPVTKEQLNQLLEAAMLAPSAKNNRPWEFVVITKRELLDKIAEIHPNTKMCSTATAVIVVVATPPTGPIEGYFPQECGAATQNILLEACYLGLGTCWCGVYPREDRVRSLCDLLSIPEPKIPISLIAVGIPAESPAQRGFFDAAKVRYID